MVTKGGRFYFRMRVPTELVKHLGKTEITQALGDFNKAQSEVAARQLSGKWAEHFLNERHRLGLVASPPAPVPVAAIPLRAPTQAEVKDLAQLAAHTMLSEDVEARVLGVNGSIELPEFGPGRPLVESIKGAISGRDVDGLRLQVEDWLHGYGVEMPADAASARRTLMTWAGELSKAQKGRKLRDEGEHVETPEVPVLLATLRAVEDLPPERKPAEHLKLRDVFELWKVGERKRPPKTIQKAAAAVEQFEALTGNPALGSVTKAMGSDFLAKLLASDMSDKTASDRLTWIQIMLNFEVTRYGRITANPWRGLTIRVKKSATRGEWSDADACKLFSLPLFQRYELPPKKKAGGDAAYWLPIIAAFTGARITEIAQLLVDDIRHDAGHWFIRFEVTKEWQSLKRDASMRTIPMHAELVRLGLPEYAQAMRDAGEPRLFPAINVSRLNNAGGTPSSWFSVLKTNAGFGRSHTFHGWRHTVETKLKRAREGRDQIDCYLGHKTDGEGAETYTHLGAHDLIETAAKVSYEGLKLPRVFKA